MARSLTTACLGVLVLLPTPAFGNGAAGAIATQPAKFLVPDTVSPQAQAILTRPIPDLSAIPVPQTRDQWHIATANFRIQPESCACID